MPKKSQISITPKLTNQSEIVLYQPNESTRLEVRLQDETVWLSQQQMSVLFGVNRQAVTKHLKNIYESNELSETATCSILELVQKEGSRLVRRNVAFYNLDAIISVGFRVNTLRGIQFRQWATRVLKDYLLKGYAVNQRLERLEQRVSKTEEQIGFFVRTSLPPAEGIFFDGQIFDAYAFASDLVRGAKKRIILIDNYVDDSVLTLLDKRKKGVSATIYTQSITTQLKLDLKKHNAQSAPIDVQQFTRSHDRFLCIDETVYHLGASMKDLGKKWFAFSRMEITTDALLSNMK